MRISDWSSDVCSSDLNELAHPQRQPGAILRLVLERLERREAGGLAVLERQIGATRSQHENLRTAVLVDENLTRDRFLGLRHQEIDADRLAPQLGRAHVSTPVTNSHPVCRHLLVTLRLTTPHSLYLPCLLHCFT